MAVEAAGVNEIVQGPERKCQGEKKKWVKDRALRNSYMKRLGRAESQHCAPEGSHFKDYLPLPVSPE